MSSQINAILNGQSKSIYKVSYYASLADATNNTNALKNNYTTESKTIYARVELLNDDACFSITDFKVNIQNKPSLEAIANVIVCDEYPLPPLAKGNYFTETDGNGTPLFAGDFIKENQTIFVFDQPNGPQGCSSNIQLKYLILYNWFLKAVLTVVVINYLLLQMLITILNPVGWVLKLSREL